MSFRIALAQLASQPFDKAANLKKAEDYIHQAARQDAQIIIFPELYLTGYSLGRRAVELAEQLDGPSVSQVADLARRHAIAIVMGFAELAPNGQAAYDAAFVVTPTGAAAPLSYRKTHLYHHEKDWFATGAQTAVVPTNFGQMGLMICYDVEFPELSRTLTLQGADWLAVPTAVMRPYEHIQEVCVQARALENHRWLISANRVGREGALEFFGRSVVCDPFGRILAQADTSETLLLADIDLSLNEEARQEGDYLSDRRPELYRR